MSRHTLDHPILGTITVTERRGSGKLSARWKEGQLHLNIPAGLPLTEIRNAIERNLAEFERIRPRPRYTDATQIHIRGNDDDPQSPSVFLSISILRASTQSGDITVVPKSSSTPPGIDILIPPAIDLAAPAIQRRINNALIALARKTAPTILLPRARRLASKLGLRVDKWEIAHGHNVLGTCYPRERRIRLSCLNVYLSPELRDYIIYHELAHLTEPGHTASFHALCNRYCNGREQALIRLLHAYPWPIER
ncbi:MAG: DUF45 domain-containing protein [Bacteroides sp.]|nr:DUF45 domain-containing protein [Bacteroides sp.]